MDNLWSIETIPVSFDDAEPVSFGELEQELVLLALAVDSLPPLFTVGHFQGPGLQ